MEILNELNTFAAEHRWIFWPIVGAIIIPIIQIRKIGYRNFREGNHPFQALIVIIIYGIIVGLIIAWLTKVIFHEKIDFIG